MSVVHDNLRREEQQAAAAAVAKDPSSADADPLNATQDDGTQELRRKQQLLVEGITRLQKTVNDLTRKLDEAREDNQSLRDLVRAQAGPAPAPGTARPQSLISQAME